MTDTVLEQAPVVEVPASEEKTETLTAHDRCDSCGAQAYVLVVFEKGELLFCNHHYQAAAEKIKTSSVKITDESWRLSDTRLDVSA